ncbi:disease resistance response protein 206-like [Euphorbia lathyris]|uniref:disease resistance response protein 206-like n=1 Tax=Euphorbia lathyris TaxID=212925 RepID=UPI0033139DAA
MDPSMMNPSKTILVFFFLFFFSISLAFSSTEQSSKEKQHEPCKELVVYYHDILYNGHNSDNATSTLIGAPDGANLTALSGQFRFGNMAVFDDPITLDNNLHSSPVGRAQGSYIYSGKNTLRVWMGFSIVFNNTQYQGIVTFVGADLISLESRDMPVVGGTGDFFMHRGVATLMTDGDEGETYYRLKIDIKFYECW